MRDFAFLIPGLFPPSTWSSCSMKAFSFVVSFNPKRAGGMTGDRLFVVLMGGEIALF